MHNMKKKQGGWGDGGGGSPPPPFANPMHGLCMWPAHELGMDNSDAVHLAAFVLRMPDPHRPSARRL